MSAFDNGGVCACQHCRAGRLIDNLTDVTRGDMDEAFSVVLHTFFLFCDQMGLTSQETAEVVSSTKAKFDAAKSEGGMVH